MPIEFWSIKQMRREKARPQKTTISLAFGRMLVSILTNSFRSMSFAWFIRARKM